jgi:integrase
MYVEHHAVYSRSKETAEYQVRVLAAHFGERPFESIRREDIAAFVAARKVAGLSGATINRNLAAISRMANLADISNPVKGVSRFRETQGRTRYLTEAEAQRLLDAASEHLKPLVFTALMTGGRFGELVALTWGDVDLDVGILWFRSRTTKSQKERIVPVSPALASMLRTVERRGINDPIFQFRGRNIRSVRTSFARARRKAGLGKDVTFHVLRHSYASWSTMNGLDPYRLQKYLGHSSMTLTARYAHLSPEYLRDGVRFFGPPNGDTK